jgi:hypothetical protein
MPKVATIPGKSVSQGSYSAFVPAPLPPELDWTPRLIGAPCRTLTGSLED